MTKKTEHRYEIILYWSNEDDAYIAEVPELPGCAADGSSYQEAIANVARHAKATSVEISLRKEGADLVLEIKDNGIGISADAENEARSFGLIGMRERAILLGGTLEIGGVERKGTTVLVRIPYEHTLTDGGVAL